MFDLELSDINELIQDTARKFAQEEIAPSVIERDKNATVATDLLMQLGELGFLGMMVDTKWGGSGLDVISYVLAMEEICKVDPSIGITISVQNSLVNWILENYGSDEQKEKYLRPLAEGKHIGAYCLSEPEAGSDARQLKTLAEKKDGYWLLNGMKNWISMGKIANTFIVFAQTNPDLAHKGIASFIVEKGTEGFSFGKDS